MGLQKRCRIFSEDCKNQLFKNKAKIQPDDERKQEWYHWGTYYLYSSPSFSFQHLISFESFDMDEKSARTTLREPLTA